MKINCQSLIDEYMTNGCLLGLPAIPAKQALECGNRIQSLDFSMLDKLPCPWRQKTHLLFPWIYEIVQSAAILDTVESLIGPDIFCLSADLFIKPPFIDRIIEWHQDSYFWRFEDNETLTTWIALTPASPENGSMRYSVGSHNKRLPHKTGDRSRSMLTKGQELEVEVPEGSIVETSLAPGEMSIHHGMLAHASGPNKTADYRIGLAVRYMPAHMPPADGPRVTVSLVRGTDSYGHFEHERPPGRNLDDRIRQHTYALEPHRAYGFATI